MRVSSRRLASISCCVLSATLLICIANETSRQQKQPISNFGLFSLRPQKDAQHPIPLHDKKGGLWFRSQESAFQLDCIIPDMVHPSRDVDGLYGVSIHLRDSCIESLVLWSRERIGETVGIVLNNEVLNVAELYTTLHQSIQLPGTESQDEAEKTIELIKGVIVNNQ